ncbi:hypothetical protein pb186bvf_001529 [Paramecium bursaria]
MGHSCSVNNQDDFTNKSINFMDNHCANSTSNYLFSAKFPQPQGYSLLLSQSTVPNYPTVKNTSILSNFNMIYCKKLFQNFLADIDEIDFEVDHSNQSVYISKTALRGIIKNSNRNDAETQKSLKIVRFTGIPSEKEKSCSYRTLMSRFKPRNRRINYSFNQVY